MTLKTIETPRNLAIVRAFRDRFGTGPDGLWRAPGRVNLIGEHTDYNDGLVLPFAIDRATTVAVRTRSDGRVRLSSAFGAADPTEFDLDSFSPDSAQGWSAYPAGVAWELRQSGVPLNGFDLYVSSDVPVGAGLSSSAALECAVAMALSDLSDAGLTPVELADIGRRAENNVVGAPTGIMDQFASMLGAADSGVFIDCRDGNFQHMPLHFEAAGIVCLVIDTKVSHAHAGGGYASRRNSCVRAAKDLGVKALRDLEATDLSWAEQTLDEETFRRVRHIVTENDRVRRTVEILVSEGPHAIGQLLNASHHSMREDFEISCPELDLAVETAQGNGALGSRMTGGGFGGSAIALVPAADVDRAWTALQAAFAARGYRRPDVFAVRPSEGAKQLV